MEGSHKYLGVYEYTYFKAKKSPRFLQTYKKFEWINSDQMKGFSFTTVLPKSSIRTLGIYPWAFTWIPNIICE